MKYEALFQIGKPGFYIAMMDEVVLAELMQELINQKAVVKLIRGSVSKTKSDFLAEIDKALELPSYFGYNWDALEECLNNLEWLNGEAYILLVSNAELLMGNDADSNFQTMVEILSSANQNWSKPVEPLERPAKPFHVVLQTSKKEASDLVEKLGQARAEFEILD